MKEVVERIEILEKDMEVIKKKLKVVHNGNIICKKCNHPWFTRSKMEMVSCPSCGTKNKVIK